MTDDVPVEEAASNTTTAGPAVEYERPATVISRTVVRVVTPIILLTAIALLFQGHNLPGGGFIGGVLTVTAVVLIYVIFGLEYLREDLLGLGTGEGDEGDGIVGGYRWVFAVGLALATGSGLVPVIADWPFMTQGVVFLQDVPLYGEFELASAFAFDLGVYLTVVGALLTVMGEVGSE